MDNLSLKSKSDLFVVFVNESKIRAKKIISIVHKKARTKMICGIKTKLELK